MFGKNPLRKQEKGAGKTLRVHSIFGTIQGEGPFQGQPAIFIRLAGCNLACFFCDTEFERDAMDLPLRDILTKVQDEQARVKAKLVVITGGEPMRQPIVELIRMLFMLDIHVQIETAGTLWPEGMDTVMGAAPEPWPVCTLVCSPKTGKVHPKVEMFCNDWKYITAVGEYSKEDGLPTHSTQRQGELLRVYRPAHGRIWLQPREEYIELAGVQHPNPTATDANMKLAAELAMTHGYRLTLQTHKILGLP